MPKTWKDLREPASSSRPDLLAFFGIPPDPESELESNIALKRRLWVKKGSNPKGAPIADAVGEIIQQATEALLNDVPMPDSAPAPAPEAPTAATLVPVDDLLDHIDGLLLGGNLSGALEVATKAVEAYPDSWVAPYAYAFVVQLGYESEELVAPELVAAGVDAAERALAMNPAEPRVWSAAASLLGATHRFDRLQQLLAAAERQLAAVPKGVLVAAATTMLRQGQVDAALSLAVRAVATDPSDRAARGDLAVAIVAAAAQMLPISSKQAMSSYEEAVSVAAWCAEGVPEAMAVVRPHRMWAARAQTKVFVGSDVWRTAVATYSGFILLPLFNLVASVPAWRVLWEGPGGRGRAKLWTVWSYHSDQPTAWRDMAIQELHREAYPRLPWAGAITREV